MLASIIRIYHYARSSECQISLLPYYIYLWSFDCQNIILVFEEQYSLTRKRYVVKHNLITEVYIMTVMETATCFGLYWPSSGCLGRSLHHARAHAYS